jgi:hypothetical protein
MINTNKKSCYLTGTLAPKNDSRIFEKIIPKILPEQSEQEKEMEVSAPHHHLYNQC